MSALYRILLAWSEFDLAIAKATGRNPKHIEQLQRDIDRWEHAILMLEINK
jgi:hypothetical protein